MELQRVRTEHVPALAVFLRTVDLTVSGLDAPTVRLWVMRAADGDVVGSTGYEISDDGRHALIRSVAVSPDDRAAGTGTRLARFAFDRAADEGARQAWLFSRRSGPFWQRLGFTPADRGEMARVLASTHQVQLFRQTGQLDREVAWSRPLDPPN
ncbi:GNAT family N-acetyltransferase [Microbacterium sp. LMI12-1-1.1]|uniref:GNAT family N-acetyltransferase n=1 Tax=Microbacterium sp. LMI12-1-1.1 TaxID=3135225 RepID=UPI00343C3E33